MIKDIQIDLQSDSKTNLKLTTRDYIIYQQCYAFIILSIIVGLRFIIINTVIGAIWYMRFIFR